MTKGLWKRVQQIAKEREISNLRLRELMADRGLRYDPIYMDSFAYPDDIRTQGARAGGNSPRPVK